MALSDLAVFSEQAYLTAVEVLDYNVDLFNSASLGTITLASSSHQGDFSETAMFGMLGNIVKRRNPYGDGDVPEIAMRHINEVSVKVAAGTRPVRIDNAWYAWILRSTQDAAAAFGQMLAQQMLEDMVNSAVGAGTAALSSHPNLIFDATAKTEKTASWVGLTRAAALFGDQSANIATWVMHSDVVTDLYVANLTNVERLFTYGAVNVSRDPFGRPLIVSDNALLKTAGAAGAANSYNVLGLVPGAINVGQNTDFNANEDTRNGSENIKTTYQAEWSYQLGLKGFAWDKATGGKAPNDAAIMQAANWDKFVTSDRDLIGVMAKFNQAVAA